MDDHFMCPNCDGWGWSSLMRLMRRILVNIIGIGPSDSFSKSKLDEGETLLYHMESVLALCPVVIFSTFSRDSSSGKGQVSGKLTSFARMIFGVCFLDLVRSTCIRSVSST
ncbi:LOW QUALITY PROTEIN: hypothetical protein PanWU01x14_111860 [Parasponia andersonii]|uniref:Uncharacterized protein n=1 Tax=Parasponia andersonii TaxID=3476 RepID=A0A2P5CYS1_PARAD|nr:LOW QUALITY PROTEIN: hypothetical protein PanWU01x14_111860 [Parasponia andersonii]